MLDSSKIKILVCCHKPSPVPSQDWFLPIQVGAALSKQDLGFQKDNLANGDPCENISEKNPNYCELTALYWAWKNIRKIYPEIEYIGLNHYRRYFAFDEHRATGCGIVKDINELGNYNLDKKKIERWLAQGKIIIPPKASLKTSLASAYEHAHVSVDLRHLHEVIKELSPEFLDDFNNLFICTNFFYDCNMFIMPIGEFEKYCEWLFKILFEVEKKVSIENYDSYQKRIFGFMSERLFTLWILHNRYKTESLNYFVYTENPAPQKKGLVALLRYYRRKFKHELGFYISKPHNKRTLERYWIVP